MLKKTYYVADGVSAISAASIPKSRKVRLTAGEAQYDLALGRLCATPPKPASKAGADENETGDQE
jgi:hypothetical protein